MTMSDTMEFILSVSMSLVYYIGSIFFYRKGVKVPINDQYLEVKHVEIWSPD